MKFFYLCSIIFIFSFPVAEQLYFEDFGDLWGNNINFELGWDNGQSTNWGVGSSYGPPQGGGTPGFNYGPNLTPPAAIFDWSPRLSCGNYPNNCNTPPGDIDGCDPDYSYSDTLYSPNISISSNNEVLVRFDFGLKYWADCQTHYNGMVIAYFNGVDWVDILVYEIGIDAGFVSIDRRTESFIAEIEEGNEIQLRWIAYGTDTYWIDGWVIDNLEILTLPKIDGVSISSDNIDPATASSGSEIFLDFISESNLNADPVVQINKKEASIINTGGANWRATYFVTEDDPDGPIEFTIDFTDIDGIDGITVKETYDESVVIVDNSPPPRFDVGLVTSSGGNVFSDIWNSTNTEVNLEVNVPQDSAISNFNFSNGNSLLFDGIDDVVEIDGNANYRFSDQFTIEAWIRAKSQIPNNYEGFLSYANATFDDDGEPESGSGFGFVFFATGWRFYLSTIDEIVYGSDMPSASAPKDQWTHLAATYNGDIIKLYRNGILVDSKNTSGNVRWSEIPSKLTIGSFTKDGVTKNFNGNIDEVRLWNYPLAQTTIKSNLFNNYTGSDSGLVGYWKIDEGSGTNIDASDTATNNSGAINGASWDIGESPIQFKTPLYDTGVIIGSTFQLRGRIDDNLFELFGDKDTITINDFNLGTKIISASQDAFEAIDSFGHDSTAEVSAYLFDDAGNYSEGDTSITNLFIDLIANAPNPVSITSDNTFSYLATLNDMISINSEFDEDVEIPELMVEELNAPIGEDLGSERFLNTYTLSGNEPEGKIDFVFSLTDYLGNPGSHSGTTDGTSVIFDKTPSVINSISIESNNTDIRWAKVDDIVRMDLESNELLYETQISLSGSNLTLYNNSDTEYIGHDNCSSRDTVVAFYVTKTMTLDDNEGKIPISIIHNDCAGNDGTEMIEATDGTYVIFDKTPPSDFIVGTVISTGGNQIEDAWNSTNEGLNVTVPVDTDTTLKNGWIQVWVKVGSNAYEELGGSSIINEFEIGNDKIISFTEEQVEDITGFMEDSIITIKAVMFDRPGNDKEGLSSNNELLIDQTPPSMQTAHIESDYSDSTLATVGNLIIVTFSTDEIIQTPAILIALDEGEVMDLGSFNWSGSYTMTDAYSDGPISFSVDSLVDVHGNPASGFDGVTDGSEVIFDNTQPTLNPISILSDNPINNDRAKVNDQITITFTGGESLMEQSGTIVSQVAIITDLGGDTYKAEYQMQDSDPEGEIAFELLVTDLVGIVSESIIETTNGSAVIFDRRNPELDFVHIESDNSNNTTIGVGGNDILLTFTADEFLTSDSVSVTIADTAASISESDGTYTATVTLTGSEPDGLIAFTIDFKDLAGNVGTQIITTTDNSYVNHDVLPPEILSVSIASNNADSTRAKVGDSIFVSFAATEVLDNLSIIIGGNDVSHLNPSPAKYKGVYIMTENDTEGIIDFNIAYTDLGGESGPDADTTTNQTQVLFDKTIPEFFLTRMLTNNIYGDSLAGIGTTDTLQFEISEPYKELTVSIVGNEKSPEQSDLRFTTYHTFTGEEEDGWVEFSIFMQDSSGNESEFLTETQNGSRVRFDGTLPELPYVNFYSNNSNDSTLCVPGDSLFLIYTVSETLRTGAISIAKNAPIDRDTTGGLYKAIYEMVGSESEGFISFSIGFEDWVGNSGDTVRVTTNESSVLFDMTPPADFELDTVYTSGGRVRLGYWNSTNESVKLKAPVPSNDETLIEGSFQPQVRFGDGSFTNLGPQIQVSGGLGIGFMILDISREDFIAMDGYEENGNARFTAIAIDKAGNSTLGSSDNSILHIDEISPELTTLTINSNNSLNDAWAKVSDEVILDLTSNEGLDSLVGIMIMDTLLFTTSNSGTSWNGIKSMLSEDPEGPIPYYITFSDTAGNSGQLVTETTDGSIVRFDKHAPEISDLLEGEGAEDITYYNNSDSLTFYWFQNDNYSGNRDAFIALGTDSLLTDIIDWTTSGLENFSGLGDLLLENDSIYYGGVFVRDSAGNHSDTIWGDGIYIDTQIPETGEINDGYWILELDHVIDSTQLQFIWKNFSDNTDIDYYELAIGTGEDTTNIMDWMRSDSSDSMTVTGLNLLRDSIYYSFIRGVDLANNISIPARTDGIIFDNAIPAVNKMTPDHALDSAGYLSVLNNDTVFIKFNRPIYVYDLLLESKIDSSVAFSHNYADSLITIIWDDTLASYDTITVIIDSAVAYNTLWIRDTLHFYSQLWGDLNLDYDLTVEDILIFNRDWPDIDLSPFNDSPPHVRPEPDGVADLTDLSAFAKMWQWKYFSLEFDTSGLIRHSQSGLNISVKSDKVLLSIPSGANMAEILVGYSNLDVTQFRLQKPSSTSLIFTATDTNNNIIQFSLADSEILDTTLTLIIPDTEQQNFNSRIQYVFLDNNSSILLKGISDYNIDIVPDKFFVYNNYPNPFNPITTIHYDLPEITDIKIEIYDLLGKKIKSLSINKKEPGRHSFNWYGKNDYGNKVSTGIYFFQLTAGQETQVKKMLLLK